MKCKLCNKETGLFYCLDCGKVIEYPDFIKGNPKLERGLDEIIVNLSSEFKKKQVRVEEFIDKSSIAKAMFHRYYQHCLHLQEMCASKQVAKIYATGDSLFNKMMGFGDKCNTNECQIAVVGTVKAGKSMFINAILGREIASSFPTPETASLTKFRYSENGDYVRVTFYNKDEWSQLWSDVKKATEMSYRDEDDKEDFMSKYHELGADKLIESYLDRDPITYKPSNIEELKAQVARFTSCKYPEHFFAKEVEVGLSEFNVPKNVVFVDTPGLNDPVEYRVNISRRYINSASVVLLCISADKAAIEATELEQTASIFHILKWATDRIYVFGTKIDFHSNYMEYWEKHTKPVFVKEFSSKFLFGSEENASKHIFPVTAWYYNLIQRAKADQAIWDTESSSKDLGKLVIECLGPLSDTQKMEILMKLGIEEGIKATSDKTRFYTSIKLVEEKTNIPYIVKMLNDGPIHNAEQIIKDDIVKMYTNVLSELLERTDGAIEKRLQEIRESKDGNLRAKIKELTQSIERDEREIPAKKQAISEILQSITNETTSFFESLNIR